MRAARASVADVYTQLRIKVPARRADAGDANTQIAAQPVQQSFTREPSATVPRASLRQGSAVVIHHGGHIEDQRDPTVACNRGA